MIPREEVRPAGFGLLEELEQRPHNCVGATSQADHAHADHDGALARGDGFGCWFVFSHWDLLS